jgi:hypothetical protein
MSKLKTGIHELYARFRIGAQGKLNGIGEGIFELVDWLAPASELGR